MVRKMKTFSQTKNIIIGIISQRIENLREETNNPGNLYKIQELKLIRDYIKSLTFLNNRNKSWLSATYIIDYNKVEVKMAIKYLELRFPPLRGFIRSCSEKNQLEKLFDFIFSLELEDNPKIHWLHMEKN